MNKETFKKKISQDYDFEKLKKWVNPLARSLITPWQMSKEEFLQSMEGNFSRQAVEQWVEQLSDEPLTSVTPKPEKTTAAMPENTAAITEKATPAAAKKIPAFYKKGDVLMHPVFKHPCVLLEEKGGIWVCGLLTSEPTCTEILIKADSRFFLDEYFTKTLFTLSDPSLCKFMYPFDNDRQVEEVLGALRKMFL